MNGPEDRSKYLSVALFWVVRVDPFCIGHALGAESHAIWSSGIRKVYGSSDA